MSTRSISSSNIKIVGYTVTLEVGGEVLAVIDRDNAELTTDLSQGVFCADKSEAEEQIPNTWRDCLELIENCEDLEKHIEDMSIKGLKEAFVVRPLVIQL